MTGATSLGLNPTLTTTTFDGSTTTLSPLEKTYTSLIQQYLSVHCLENATFYAERLFATSSSSSHALYLLALCYYRQGQPQRSKWVLEHCSHGREQTQDLLYLKALCCYDLQEYALAEESLLRRARKDFRKTSGESMNQYIVNTTPCPVPCGAVGLQLLAKVCAKSNRKNRAILYYQMSLQLDPFLWTSWEALCDLGVSDMNPSQVFGVTPAANHFEIAPPPTQQQSRSSIFSPETPHFQYSDEAANRQNAPPASAGAMSGISILQPSEAATPDVSTLQRTLVYSTNSKAAPPANTLFETPNLTPIPKEQSYAANTTKGTTRAVQRARKVVFRDYYQPSPDVTTSTTAKPRSLFWSGLSDHSQKSRTPQLHNKALFTSMSSEQKSILSTNKKSYTSKYTPTQIKQQMTQQSYHRRASATQHTETEPTLESASNKDGGVSRSEDVNDPEDDNKLNAVQSVLELLCLLGTAQWHLGQFRSKKAIEIFQQLPDDHYLTGWVLNQVGQAYFAMADYSNAIRTLQLMEQVEPHRMAGLQVLSTALWQTKREVELSHLAQRVTDFDRLSPEVWCVVGNCFSLQKEHETALVFFRRSIQLDRSFTYSHTLSGHEYFANEDFEKAIACFRDAIQADERHYNAWYGLGAVYYRQEKFDLAEYHFHKACTINPQSSVLICHLGMAQNANGKPFESLDTLQAAFRLDPHNPQAHYQRSLVYQALERYEEALAELSKVRDAAPREAQIHFAMGRLHKRLGRTDKALRCFLDALDLDPKDTNLIKSAMEKMDEPDVEEEISAF